MMEYWLVAMVVSSLYGCYTAGKNGYHKLKERREEKRRKQMSPYEKRQLVHDQIELMHGQMQDLLQEKETLDDAIKTAEESSRELGRQIRDLNSRVDQLGYDALTPNRPAPASDPDADTAASAPEQRTSEEAIFVPGGVPRRSSQ